MEVDPVLIIVVIGSVGGTRTFHRLMCAIEDLGFIIKDTILWLYGSGFPKAQDLGKMIDKRARAERKIIGHYIAPDGIFRDCKNHKPNEEIRNPETHYGYKTSGYRPIDAPSTDLAKHWDGFKVGGIKPAYEPIVWAIKPPEGSYVDNVLKWSVGAVNVDECRIDTTDNLEHETMGWASANHEGRKRPWHKNAKKQVFGNNKGRFPANIILSHHPECVQVGMKRVRNKSGSVSGLESSKPAKNVYGEYERHTFKKHGDSIGLETVESWQCHPDCPVRLLDEQSSSNMHNAGKAREAIREIGKTGLFPMDGDGHRFGDNGGASRFFYCAKASRSERNAGLEGMKEKPVHWSSGHKNPGSFQAEGTKKQMTNHHPTVKPIKLFEWLIKLVAREGQIIIDPFIGSGTTAIAAHNTGRRCVGVEKEGEYLEIARKRIEYWESQPRQMEMGI